jgi:hypothetical protein
VLLSVRAGDLPSFIPATHTPKNIGKSTQTTTDGGKFLPLGMDDVELALLKLRKVS